MLGFVLLPNYWNFVRKSTPLHVFPLIACKIAIQYFIHLYLTTILPYPPAFKGYALRKMAEQWADRLID